MFVVLRKKPEDKEWNICGVFNSSIVAYGSVFNQRSNGYESRYYSANNVYIDENGNHTWN